ncbi:hypothetical protein ACO9S2_03095 [Nitrospira sp. NS4]|uniref:hypothetical protein n=1 Tax=Nitrospira sp. NS4 TaxID=3414498 RepID=UPI003C2E7B67
MASHTACPIPLVLGGGLVRVYFGTRDTDQRPRIGYVVLDMAEPTKILELSADPVLEPGPWGHFDDNGVYPGCLVNESGRLLMYYIGRSNGRGPLYSMAIGLAESVDAGLTFKKTIPCPLVDRGPFDPWMVSTPWVLHEPGAGWRMWYLSGIGWESLENDLSLYHIKYAESRNGREWTRDGRVALDIEGDETNIASPCVWRESAGYRALYCVASRHGGYRLGEARSDDGIRWRKLGVPDGLARSGEGWDSACMAYPATFMHEGRRYLLYSGNENGRGGVGIAVEESFG